MSPFNGSPRSETAGTVPPEVLAIAVALAVEWQAADAETELDERPAPASRGKWSGRREERPTTYRWS